MVQAIRDQGTTVILVEQSVNLALTVAETAYFMEKGEIRFHGPTAELLDAARPAPLGVPRGRRHRSGDKAPGERGRTPAAQRDRRRRRRARSGRARDAAAEADAPDGGSRSSAAPVLRGAWT